MQPLRKVINDAPDMVPIPEELRHKRIEMILWPLEGEVDDKSTQCAEAGRWQFKTMRVQNVIMPTREERYER